MNQVTLMLVVTDGTFIQSLLYITYLLNAYLKSYQCFLLCHRKLVLYPNGNAKINGNDHISLYLALADTSVISDGSQIDVRLKCFVYDQIQDKYLTIQGGFSFLFLFIYFLLQQQWLMAIFESV